jgi:hypothetical protein
MPRIKFAKTYSRSNERLAILLFLLWFVSMGATFLLTDDEDIIKGVGFLTFIILVGTVLKQGIKLHKEFRCPDCGGEVDEPLETDPDNYGGAPSLRLCKRCDVLWHVGNVNDS